MNCAICFQIRLKFQKYVHITLELQCFSQYREKFFKQPEKVGVGSYTTRNKDKTHIYNENDILT